eukprot:TRINITY_DN9098_c0_g2_i1.p1 TRINITY_DN9098_c0_g2~~TRINITY_DN9098_c0_g2_i1.p1  ORF type:complete len:600 (-),score=51.13 TRINITY_DN9098_c0_g2_i1:462-2159(-)
MLSVVLLSISAYNLVNAQVQTIDETPCSSQLAEFQTQCAVDSKIEGLQGFRNQVDDTLALCCAEEDCCSKFRSLLQNECFQCEDIVEETRIITLYMALCETVLTVPMCMFQQKVPQQESQCTMLGFNLVSLCGNLKQDLKYNADGYSCCWENDCCDIARDYLSGDCNQECVADNDVVVVQAAGDIIARMWRSACMLPDDLELCSKIQVMSVGQQELVLPGVAEEKNTGVQGTAVQNEVAGSVSPTLLSSCTEVDVQNFGFDGLAIRVENLHNFCAEKSKAINTPAENLCCDHVEEVLQVACEYYSSCSSTPQEILGLVTPSIIQQWIDPTSSFSCTPPSITQTCDIPKALQLITQKEDNEQTENRNRTVDFTGIQGLDGQAVILMSAGNDDLLSIQQRFFEQKQAEVEEKNLTVFDILKMAPYFRGNIQHSHHTRVNLFALMRLRIRGPQQARGGRVQRIDRNIEVVCMAKGKKGKGKKARAPGLFEVEEISPPRRSLGIHCFHPNTHCGEEIEVEGQGYVVSSVVLRYKLERGKYVRDHNKLEVQKTPRYFLNLMLKDLYEERD